MKKILITGARSGIAKGVIEKLKIKNYFIYVTVRTEKQLENVTRIYKNDSNVKCLKLDITNDSDLKKINNLDIDILISNAAIGYGSSVLEMDLEKLKENFDVNVFCNVKLVQMVLKSMLKKGSGKIIFMSSLASIIPIPFIGSYSATKASINKLAECLKKELKYINKNIDIVLIEPGLYKTGFNNVMFENKYNKTEYFKEELELIRKRENFLLKYFEKRKLNSIVNKISTAVNCKKSKFIYRSPLSQVIFAKIYQLFFQ